MRVRRVLRLIPSRKSPWRQHQVGIHKRQPRITLTDSADFGEFLPLAVSTSGPATNAQVRVEGKREEGDMETETEEEEEEKTQEKKQLRDAGGGERR